MTKKPSLTVSGDAYYYVKLFSKVMGAPVSKVASDALLCWWNSYGASAVSAEEDRAIFFEDHPAASEKDYGKWMRMKLPYL